MFLFVLFKFGLLVFFFGEGFQYTMQLRATGGESRNNILRRRLEKGNNIGDELVLALDAAEGLKLVFTNINGLLYICGFQAGKNIVFLDRKSVV